MSIIVCSSHFSVQYVICFTDFKPDQWSADHLDCSETVIWKSSLIAGYNYLLVKNAFCQFRKFVQTLLCCVVNMDGIMCLCRISCEIQYFHDYLTWHASAGQPRRHLLTTGWSAFVNKKKLVSGDAVLFLRYRN